MAKHDIFISYSRNDKALVLPLVERINRELGTDCWIDLTGIESGTKFERKLIEAIDGCQVMLFMLSDNSLNSDWTEREVLYAESEGKRIVPVLIDGDKLRGWFKFHFGNVDYIDIRIDEQKDKLIRDLKSCHHAPVETEKNVETVENTKKKEDNKAQDAATPNKNIGGKKPLTDFIRKPYYVIAVFAFCAFVLIGLFNWHPQTKVVEEPVEQPVEEPVQTELTVQTLQGEGDGMARSAAFSPDGKWIVFTSWRPTPIRILDAQTGQFLQRLEGHTGCVNSAAFSPDSKRIVSASDDKTVRIWDAQTGKLLLTLEGHSSHVISAAFSPDGKQIVSASWDKTVRIWDAQTGELLLKLEGHIRSAAFSPEGKRIVSASRDKTVRIWGLQTGQLLRTLEGHTDIVETAAFSHDGQRIVSASRDKTVRIWDARTGKLFKTLEGHTGPVRSAAFSPDGRRIVSASNDHTFRIWNLPDDWTNPSQEKVE